MKKLVLMVVAAVAIGFVSCGNKSANQAPADQTEVATAADVDLENATADLAAQLESGDANKLQAALDAVQAKLAELVQSNPELAQEYLTKVQDFLKENAEKVKQVVGDNVVVQTAVSALTETSAESIISGLQSKIGAVGEAGQEAVDAAKQAGQDAVDAAKQAAQAKVDEAKQAAQEKVDEAKQKASDAVNKAADEAKSKANEKVDEAANKALKSLGL